MQSYQTYIQSLHKSNNVANDQEIRSEYQKHLHHSFTNEMLQCVLKPLHDKISPLQKNYLKQNKYNKSSMVVVVSSLISRREVNQFIIHNHISTLTAKAFLAGYNQSLDKIKEQQTIEIEEENMRAAEGI